MALIPLIQPPIMKLMTTDKMRKVKMVQAREVSKTEKIIFPIVVSTFVILLLPSTAPLIGCLMLGNLFRETGVTDRLSDTAQNALMNIITIFLATSVGATMGAETFLNIRTIYIIFLGLVSFLNIHCRRASRRHRDVQDLRRPDQSAYRFGGRVRSSHGGARVSGRRPQVQQEQLPAHACHGLRTSQASSAPLSPPVSSLSVFG